MTNPECRMSAKVPIVCFERRIEQNVITKDANQCFDVLALPPTFWTVAGTPWPARRWPCGMLFGSVVCLGADCPHPGCAQPATAVRGQPKKSVLHEIVASMIRFSSGLRTISGPCFG